MNLNRTTIASFEDNSKRGLNITFKDGKHEAIIKDGEKEWAGRTLIRNGPVFGGQVRPTSTFSGWDGQGEGRTR